MRFRCTVRWVKSTLSLGMRHDRHQDRRRRDIGGSPPIRSSPYTATPGGLPSEAFPKPGYIEIHIGGLREAHCPDAALSFAATAAFAHKLSNEMKAIDAALPKASSMPSSPQK